MNIRDYIGEGTEYVKKEALEVKRPKSWLKSVSAFANGKGGVLLFGVSDDDTLVGLKNAEGDIDYVDITEDEFNAQMKADMDELESMFAESHRLEDEIRLQLNRLKFGG